MIDRGMTPEEVLTELQKGDRYIQERMNGLTIKNSKKLKCKFVKHNEILSVSNYVVPETQDSVVVYAVKQLHTLNGKDYSSMCLNYYFKTPYGTYIMPFFQGAKLAEYMEVTCHAVDRMKMRLGKDFDAFFREDWIKKNEATMAIVDYNYNGNDNEYVAHIGDAFLILQCEDSGKKTIVKTVLSTDELYVNQLKDKLNSKKAGEYFCGKLLDEIDAISAMHLKELRKRGIVMKVA